MKTLLYTVHTNKIYSELIYCSVVLYKCLLSEENTKHISGGSTALSLVPYFGIDRQD